MEKKDILIRLLKEGHITDEEFKLLYDEPIEVLKWNREYPQQPMPTVPLNPEPLHWFPLNPDPLYPYDDKPMIWHGVIHPKTGEYIGPTLVNIC